MSNEEREKIIKKHLGINTPDWIVQNCIKMIYEFEYIELNRHIIGFEDSSTTRSTQL